MTPPVVRVFLFTYRRNHLLQRSVDSLLAQSFQDWVCELHNDDPADPFPGKLVAEIGDPRLFAVTHPQNLGPVRAFNLMFRDGFDERYVSMLQDDNWWGSDFLAVMVREMDARPGVEMGWANMRLVEEQADGSWRDTGRTVWDHHTGEDPVLFYWPHPRHLLGALHSDGAMLVRTADAGRLALPTDTPFGMVECTRERLYRFPILLVPRPLAQFAVTRETYRTKSAVRYGQAKALQAASFFRHVRPGPDECRRMWAEARAAAPPRTGSLIAAGLIDPDARYVLRYSRPVDWLRYLKTGIRRPATWVRTLRAKRNLPGLWAAFDDGTRELQQRAAAGGAGGV